MVQIHKWKIQADWSHIVLATMMTAVSVWYFLDARDASSSTYNLIMIAPCVATIVFLYLVTLVLEIRVHSLDADHLPQEQSLRGLLEPASIRNAAMMTLLVVYVLLLEPLGFEIASFLFIALSLLLQGERRIERVVIFSALFSAFATWTISSLSLTPIPTSFM